MEKDDSPGIHPPLLGFAMEDIKVPRDLPDDLFDGYQLLFDDVDDDHIEGNDGAKIYYKPVKPGLFKISASSADVAAMKKLKHLAPVLKKRVADKLGCSIQQINTLTPVVLFTKVIFSRRLLGNFTEMCNEGLQ